MTDKDTETVTAISERPPVFGAVFTGFLIIALFIGGFFAWAGVAPPQSPATSPGSINIHTSRTTVHSTAAAAAPPLSARAGGSPKWPRVGRLVDIGNTGEQVAPSRLIWPMKC